MLNVLVNPNPKYKHLFKSQSQISKYVWTFKNESSKFAISVTTAIRQTSRFICNDLGSHLVRVTGRVFGVPIPLLLRNNDLETPLKF